MNNELIGNVTTVIKTVSMMFAGYFLGYCISIGLNLPISQEQLSEIFFTIILFIAAYFDAKFPNAFKFLKNDAVVAVETEEDLINQDYYEGES